MRRNLEPCFQGKKGAQENLNGYGQRLSALEKLSSKAADDEHIFKQVAYGKRSLCGCGSGGGSIDLELASKGRVRLTKQSQIDGKDLKS